ncbi:MAG: lipopolysaccharide heptosyltransferase II [Candidatus Omnitrophota bacterium]
MNILQLIPKLNIGGVEKGTIEVARYLTLNGHKAVVVSGGGIFEKNLAALGARHYKLSIGRKNPFYMIYSYFKLRNIILKENIDIVHARSRVPALVGFFAARSCGRTFITTAHGQYKKHLISRVMGWGKVVIVANELMARYMKENFGVPLKKMMIIPRGVDLKKFSFIQSQEKKAKRFRIGMVCRYTSLKGHADFLKAISYISRKRHNIEAVIMGDKSSAKPEYLKKLELISRRLMIDNIVTFKDSNADVSEVMKDMNILVSANREQEAFGRSVIEAQARGVPVVATKVGGLLEIIADGVTGLFCNPMDPSDMAKKIFRYIDTPDLMHEIALNARESVVKNYSLDKTMKMTVDAYAQILGRKNILIFKMSSLGDIILSMPSIRAIRERFRAARINVLVDARLREVLNNCPYIDEVITCDFKGRDKGLGFWKLAARLRSEDFDISVDLQNNRKSHLLAAFAAVKERYGYDNGKFSFLLNRKISLPSELKDPVGHQAGVLGIMGVVTLEKRLELWPSLDSEAWTENFLKDNWVKKDRGLIGFSLSASRRWQSKNWGLGSMLNLTEMLAKHQGMRVVIVGAREDQADALEFMKKSKAKPVNAVGKTNISQLISLIKRCDVFVAGDSAPMHIAAAVGTPFVAIFGPTDPARHLPPADKYKVFNTGQKCAPCYKPVCGMESPKCMTSIKPAMVFDGIMELMGKTADSDK